MSDYKTNPTDAERHGGHRTDSGAGAAAEEGRDGFFGRFGGRFVADLLWEPLQQLEEAFVRECKKHSFQEQLARFRHQFIGRPTPLYEAQNLTAELGGARIYFKLEGLAHSGAHKINNAIGQALIAKAMGKRRIIAETGAGQHGVATATVCAALRLPCTVYMGAVDMRRQQPNVLRMRLLGAEVRAVESGSATLKDAVNAALRDWAASYEDTHYLLGSALGPHPFPTMVAAFQSVIGEECAAQASEQGFAPDYCIACVGGGSNAIGFFAPWLDSESPHLIGVEAGGRGAGIGEHATRIATANGDPFSTESSTAPTPPNSRATIGIAQGYKSYFLQRSDGQLAPTHSISAGLDYPGIGPQLADLAERGRVHFARASDDEALAALQRTAESEGVLAALESSHAIAYAIKLAPRCTAKECIIVNISGSGEKDLFIIAKATSPAEWREFLLREAASIE